MSGAGPTGRLTVVAAGSDVVERLSELGGADGWFTGTGQIEDVALRVVSEGTDTVTNLRGRFNLLTLSGPRGGPFAVTLARLSDGGLQVFGGELVRGRSGGVTVTFFPALRDTALPKGAPGIWARTAAASEANAHDDEDSLEEPTPEAGDLVEHFAFGICEVLTAEGDRLRIRDVDGPRRVREVALSMLRVTGPTESDGKKLFQLVRRGAP
jgi:hypothetical protein